MTLLYLSLAYLIGISAGRQLWDAGWIGCGFPVWLWALPLLALPLPFLWEKRQHSASTLPRRWPASAGFTQPTPEWGTALWTALLLALLAGVLRFASQPLTPCFAPDDLAYYNSPTDAASSGSTVTLRGYVDNYPTVKNGRQPIHLRVESIRWDGVERAVTGRVLMRVGTAPRYRYGQPLQATGLLSDPPIFDTFDYREYLARKGIHSQLDSPRLELLDGPPEGLPLYRILYALRLRGEGVINRLLPEPYAALANGMLLGIETGIPDELYEEFRITGTSHVIVISGSNVAIVSGVLMASFNRLWKRRAIWPTLAGIGAYALLVGGDPAVLRAALMGSLFVVATVLNRQSTALLSLGVACWGMTLLNPLTRWDVGFELSLAATAGLILFSPGLTAAVQRIWPMHFTWGGYLVGGLAAQGSQLLLGLLQDGLLVTLAANLTTLPLVVYYFGKLSLVSLLTNFLIAPVQPLIMLWGGAGLLVGLTGIWFVAQPLLWVAYLCLVWTVAMVRWSAALPWASVDILGYGVGGLTLTYGLLFAWHWRGKLAQVVRWRPVLNGAVVWRWVGTAGLPALAVGALLLWQVLLSRPDGYLHLYFLDIGQGDGILVQTPSGRQMLIDGGSDPQRLFAQLGRAMPFWDRSLDLVVATHPDWDHMGGQMELPARFAVDEALVSETLREHKDFAGWLAVMESAGVEIATQGENGWVDLGDGVALWVLWPPPEEEMPPVEDEDKNERSLVLRLVYGEFSVLLTGDAGLPAEKAMLKNGQPLAAHILKVGHHGSRNSTGPEFVQAVQPEVAIIQVGENRYGHPDESVLATLAGRLLLRNDLHGQIHVRSDGADMWIDTERGNPLAGVESSLAPPTPVE